MSERTDNEMRQIQKGLEDFLQRELQLYTIEEEKQEKELDMKKYQFYEEDWDSKPTGGSGRSRKGSNRKGSSTGRSRNGNSSGSRSNTQQKNRSNTTKRQKSSDTTKSRKNSKTSGSKTSGSKTSGSKTTDSRKSAKQRESVQTSRDSENKTGKSRLIRILLIIAVILALLGLGLYLLVGMVYSKMNYSEIPALSSQPMQEDGVVNILLIGNDSRANGEDGRSDAMILLSISSRTKSIYMTSLLRDMYVEIPGHDGNRLNAAYSFGGAELLMETVEQNFDITVNRYIQVNFEAFAGMVDAVDGVDLELTTEEIEYVNGYLVEYNILTDRPQGTDNMDPSVSGMVHLNGPQALAYCRIRYLGTDFGRTERQRKVLTEVIRKLPKAVFSNGGELVDGLMPNLTTNLTQGECFRLSLMAGRLLAYDIISDNIPQPGTYKNATIRKMSVLEVDFEANKKYLKEKIYGEEFP